MNTRIKICGITTLHDAMLAAQAGADALGFVFAESPRRIAPAAAADIVRRLPPFVQAVGVFRDAPLDEVLRRSAGALVDVVQLHGDESPDYCERIELPVIKRLPVTTADDRQALERRRAGYAVAATLLDPGCGSGRPFAWSVARGLQGPVIVAGGLHAANVAEAIARARPYAVDVASGVERRPGVKDREKILAFVRAVRDADARRVA